MTNTPTSEETITDLIYSTCSPALRMELEWIWCKIEDASDFVHEERQEITIPADKEREYFAILERSLYACMSFNYLNRD